MSRNFHSESVDLGSWRRGSHPSPRNRALRGRRVVVTPADGASPRTSLRSRAAPPSAPNDSAQVPNRRTILSGLQAPIAACHGQRPAHGTLDGLVAGVEQQARREVVADRCRRRALSDLRLVDVELGIEFLGDGRAPRLAHALIAAADVGARGAHVDAQPRSDRRWWRRAYLRTHR